MGAPFNITIGGDPDGVARVSGSFAEFAERAGLPAAVRRSIQVALDEFLHNTLAYGFPTGERGEVTVEVALGNGRVIVTLTDDGVPFDPLARATPDVALPVAEREIGGLGIHLVRRMMDEVTYRRHGDRNIVVLTKRWTDGPREGERRGMPMEIITRTTQDITIVALAGNLDSNSSPQVQQALDGILAGGARKVVVDFTALDYISSAGLRVLLGAAKKLQPPGGALRLFGLNETVREVFEISGFAKILAVRGTEQEALAGL